MKMMKKMLLGTASVALLASVAPAMAATADVYMVGVLSVADQGTVDPGSAPLALTTAAISGYTLAGDATVQVGQLPNTFNPYGGDDVTHQFGALAANNFNGYATFTLAAPVTSFSLLWGSPSNDDTVSLYTGSNGTGTLIGAVTANDLYAAQSAGLPSFSAFGNNNGPGDVFAITSSQAIGSAVLSSSQQAFEFGDISAGNAAAVPLPGTLALFAFALAGLLGSGLWSNRKATLIRRH